MIFVEFLRASHKYFLLNEQMHIMDKISGYFPSYESSPERLILPPHGFRNCAVSSQLCKIVQDATLLPYSHSCPSNDHHNYYYKD